MSDPRDTSTPPDGAPAELAALGAAYYADAVHPEEGPNPAQPAPSGLLLGGAPTTFEPTEGSPPFINRTLSLDEWRAYVAGYQFGTLPPSRVVLHHTYRPTRESWAGLATMRGMQRHYAGLGWTSGPHVYVAEDGIWLATPMSRVGIHAGTGNGSVKQGWYSIGLEMVGFFDHERPSGRTWAHAVAVMGELSRRLAIPVRKLISFHRDYTTLKSCPGRAVAKEWVWGEVDRYLTATPTTSMTTHGLTFAAEPRITRDVFAAVLAARQSPAAPEAARLYEIPISYGLDPGVALAFYDHESKCGTLGAAVVTRSWGNNRRGRGRETHVGPVPGKPGNFAHYATIADALHDWCVHIRKGYIGGDVNKGVPLPTVEQAIPVYAPSSDNNKPEAYIAAVRESLRRWAAAPDPWAGWGDAAPLNPAYSIPRRWSQEGNLGQALGPEQPRPGGAGAVQWFERGLIVWLGGERTEVIR